MKTRITSLFVIALAIFSANSKAQSVPSSWTSKGVGGGGAMYSPSISPFNGNNLFISCDMSPVHQSSDFGQTYSLLHYLQVEGGRNSEVQFTSNPLKVFVLRKNGNFYAPAKSYDGGTNWVNATNPTALGGAFQYHASPADTDLVVISDAHKIYFSNNENTSGYTTLLNYPATYGGHLAGVYFENKDTIYVCSHDTLIYTFNGGGSWASATAGTNGIPSTEHIVSFKGAKQGGRWVFFAVTIQANAVSKIYQTYCEDFPFYKGIYKLSQLQNSWVAIGANLPNTNDKVYVLGLAKNDTSVVYVAGQSNSAGVTLGALFTSTNSGSSFTLKFLNSGNFNLNNNITTGWLGKHVNNLAKFKWNGLNYIGGLAVDPNNSSRIIIGDGMMAHTSIDYGSNWQQAYTDVNYDNAPSVLLQESHLYKTSGLETTSAYWLDWTSPTSIFATYNDIVARRSTDGGQMWSFDIYGLDSSKINDVNMTIKNVSTGKMYAACGEVAGSNGDYTDARALWSKGRVSVSSDNGINWTTVKSFGSTVSSVAFDPNSVNGLYATVMSAMGGNGDVYHCVDVINNPTVWTRLTAPPRTENRALQIIVLNNGDLVAVYGSRDISTTSTPSFSFSNSSGVFYSTDGGLSWADNNPSTMTKSTVNVEIDRNDPTQSTWLAFVSATGNLGGVFRTTNKGVNWTQVYNSPVLSGSFHPSLANEMYICTTKSGLVYATNTNSNSFTITPVTSYPFRNPQKVFFNPYNINEVWVTSFGNGIKMGTTNTPSANTLSVSPNTLSLPSAASNYISFSISSNVNWTISSNQNWLTLNKTSGNGNATITVIASENMSKTPRNASIKVSSTGLADQLISVTQKDTSVQLNVSLSLISLPAAFNDYVSFNVQSDAQWTASSDQPWLIVNPVQGNGNGTIKLTAEENKGNAPRTAKITVECGLLAQKVVTINQSDTVIIQPSIKASPDTVYLFASDNSTGKITITSNVDWDAKVNQSWLSINSNKGSNNGEIFVQAAVNNSKKVRSGKVIISSLGLPDYTITIIQKDTVLSTLTVSVDTIYLPATASNSKGFGISANTTWAVQTSDSWLTVNKNTGNGNDIIILNAEMNQESKSRNAYVTVSGKGVNDTKVCVIQADTMIISSIEEESSDEIFATVFPNPANELLIIQAIGLVNKDIQIELYDIKGNIVSKTKVLQGSTIAFIDVQTLYSGTYFIKMINENTVQTKKIIIQKDME